MPINDSAVKPPPRKVGSQRSTPVKSAPVVNTQSPNERRRDGLLGLASLAQGVCMMTNQWADVAAIGQHFPPVAAELANIADANETIAKPIDFLIEIGPYGALITAVMPLALQIMANHRIVDANRLLARGVVPPEVLEAQARAQAAQMQAEYMRAQQEAMAEAEAATKALEQMMIQRNEMMNGAKVAA